jgi:hypothetical protein
MILAFRSDETLRERVAEELAALAGRYGDVDNAKFE